MINPVNKSLLSAFSFIFMMLASQISMADSNPFSLSEPSTTAVQLADGNMKCGAGKCGANMKKKAAKCGDSMKKKASKCGDSMKKKVESKCGAAHMKEQGGKCGNSMKKEMKKKTKCGAGKCSGK